MDMDFLSDPIFSDLGRSDFIGGIDNEALDFGHLEQFMQVAAAVGDDTNNTNHANSIAGCNAKAESPPIIAPSSSLSPASTSSSSISASSSPAIAATSTDDTNLPITNTILSRISLTTTPIATPTNATSIAHSQNHTAHLPESPPDSGSEPPYSPLQDVHGLTLTSRDIYNDLPAIHQTSALHELQMQPQYTTAPPLHQPLLSQHHQQQQQHNQSNFTHNHQNHLNTTHHHNQHNHLHSSAAHDDNSGSNSIRVKHEASLLMNPTGLTQAIATNNNTHNNPNDTQIEIPTNQLLYTNINTTNTTNNNTNIIMTYENVSSGLYAATSYQNISSMSTAEHQSPAGILTSITDAPRVQVVGTSPAVHRTSAPSTPVHHSASRKRKMSTQLDCPEYTNIKPDPGLAMSPHQQKVSGSPTSPVSISLPTQHHDISSTPAHSAASLSPALSIVNSNPDTSIDGSQNNNGENADGNALTPCIRFSPFQPQNWHKLCDQSLQDIAVVYYRVDADKGFNFSVSDDAFVCQKKNHFQITCHARLQGDAKFVKTPSGLEKIKSFHLHFYGVKLEAPNQTIRVEQSQSDRSKKPFYPVPIDLQSHIVSKITVGRLHFSETTNNNMRKKGRPNPEQRYFQLVVGLHVHTTSGNFPVISQGSERIIVRASNPGQFESDVDLCWQRGLTQDSIFHAGRVGINTDRPDESLVVHGNLKVSGHIVQPSDSRAKQEIGELDTSVQLRNLQKIRIVRYRYEPQFAVHSGLRRASESDAEEIVDTGVIAQEVREIIPDAVQEAGSIVLPNGNVIENFLLVNKDRILMENIGAVKELCKVTGSLETRIEHLERLNNRLIRAKECEQKSIGDHLGKKNSLQDGYEMCSNRTLQAIILMLVIVMAACLAAVSTLYFVEHNRQHHNHKQLERLQALNNGHLFGHDSVLISDQERSLMQLHNIHMLSANKTHSSYWPNFLFDSSTIRTPSTNSSKLRYNYSYNGSTEIYTTHGRNDELTVVMEKPIVNLQPLQAPYRITTSAPPHIRLNKTISSKNKSKWPLPQTVIRAAATSHTGLKQINHGANTHSGTGSNFNNTPLTADEESANITETSSEKVADSIPLPQDFENNSIDIDSQHVAKKVASASSKTATSKLATSLNDAAQEASLLVENGDTDITLKLAEHVIADPIVSTASSNIIGVADITVSVNSPKLNGANPGIYNVYKAVSPPTSTHALTTNKIGTENTQKNYSVDTAPISNKSGGGGHAGLDNSSDNADAFDLQNLSSTNESAADNPITAIFGFEFDGARESALGRRSAMQRSVSWLTRRTLLAETFGAPVQCVEQSTRDDISNCQSVCFEDSNQLSAQSRHTIPIVQSKSEIENGDIHQEQDQDVRIHDDDSDSDEDEVSGEDLNDPQSSNIEDISSLANTRNTSAIINGKSSHATISKQFSSTEQLQQQQQQQQSQSTDNTADTIETIDAHPSSDEHLNADPKFGNQNDSPLTPSLSVEAHLPPNSNCWKISNFIIADGLNKTLGLEEYCPNIGQSLNLTYIVPLSRFFKETNIELHLSSATPLIWTICSNEEHTRQNGKYIVNSPNEFQQSGSILQQRQGTSILFLNIPTRGFFVRDLALRATNDLEKKNICHERAHEANTIFQYNFRIIRDCE